MGVGSLTPENRKPYYIAGGVSLVLFWYGFSTYLKNKERLGSSVLRMVTFHIKESPEVHELVGTPVILKRGITGDPWIEGIVSPVKGKVDMSFQVEGPAGVATVYFTSIRKEKTDPFEVLRFLVVPDGDSHRSLSLLGLVSDIDSFE
ncbi:cytochrome oxidase assembly protein 1 [Malassezia sp. CBS 17886]|nr:cytochrome oxidase assembly protein 1 [Malassezia sp. CBS 17886]